MSYRETIIRSVDYVYFYTVLLQQQGSQHKRKESEQRYQLIMQKKSASLSKQTMASVSISQSDANAESNVNSDEEDEIKEVGIQTDELLRTCKYGCGDSDTATKFYTGLPSWDVYVLIFNFIVSCIQSFRKSISKLALQDELLMVLMCLRLNLLVTDIAYHFEILNSTVTFVFHQWIEIFYSRL